MHDEPLLSCVRQPTGAGDDVTEAETLNPTRKEPNRRPRGISITNFHAKLIAYELTQRYASDSVEKLATALADAQAQVDLNPHQVETALFAFRSPFSKGAILADEVGLGKTIEAGLLLAQKWAERKRRLLVILPANLRKQWAQELADKFFLPSVILEAKSFNQTIRDGNLNPFLQDGVILCSYQFARSKEPYLKQVTWEMVVIELPPAHQALAPAVVDLLSSYQIERHIQRDRDNGPNRLKKEVALSPEFIALWEKIKPKTTYRVEFETDMLVTNAVDALKRMEKIEIPIISVTTGQIGVVKGGVTTTAVSAAQEKVALNRQSVPDVLAYLQNETELTRSTLVRILKDSGRLAEVFNNPQRFMDNVASLVKSELHRMLVDGIKYERISSQVGGEWEMVLFKNEELVNYLTALQITKSIYEYVEYDSEVERIFAKRMDERDDIKLFVKLPCWFEIQTPVGAYNPDWAIVKHDGQTLYLVRETKGTKDFLKLRTTEADKVRCGQKHFEALGVPFAVAVKADEV